MLSNYKFTITLFFLTLLHFSSCIKPGRDFSHYKVPPIPDYALEKNWAALPDRKDSADAVPLNSGLKDEQADAKVDVFFVHPTMYYKRKSWNADVNDEKTNRLVDIYPIRQQASAFNVCCKVYAPRYRQATLYSFIDGKGNGNEALDTAYADVKNAFKYYLEHYNHGRPIILAGHSQGTFLAERLIRDFFDNDPKLRKLFVAAYLIGGTIGENCFTTIVPCDSASQTGCYVAWHTRKYGSDFNKPTKKTVNAPAFVNYNRYVCVNPLTWTRDTAYAPASLNLGSVPKTFDRIDKGKVDAKISSQKIIWSHVHGLRGYVGGTNYHVVDYSLFYMNIRANVLERCGEYLKKNGR